MINWNKFRNYGVVMDKYRFAGILLHRIYRILNYMTRKEYYYFKDTKTDIENPAIIVFWHGKIFTVCNATREIIKKASMVSASKDGDILGELLRREGNELIRGSSNRDNIKSLKEALRYAKQGYTLGIAIDGPKGPIHEPKPGAIFIAQKTGLPIIPVSSYTDRKWIFEKLWDKLEIPKFFSRNIHYMGEPFYISKDTDIETAAEIIKKNIHKCTDRAYEIYNRKYMSDRKNTE